MRFLRYEEGAIPPHGDRAPASSSSSPRRPGLRTDAPSSATTPASRHPSGGVDRATSPDRGIWQPGSADDEQVIKLSAVGGRSPPRRVSKDRARRNSQRRDRGLSHVWRQKRKARRPRAFRVDGARPWFRPCASDFDLTQPAEGGFEPPIRLIGVVGRSCGSQDDDRDGLRPARPMAIAALPRPAPSSVLRAGREAPRHR